MCIFKLYLKAVNLFDESIINSYGLMDIQFYKFNLQNVLKSQFFTITDVSEKRHAMKREIK